jgi:hypothetical protein
MTGVEWAEMVEWVEARFPDTSWNPEQAVAYFYDLQKHDAADVWAGLFHLYEQGTRFAPTGSSILAATLEQVRTQARQDVYRALPEARGHGITWQDYTKLRFGEPMTAWEAIKQIHGERTDCTNPRCDVHDNQPQQEENHGEHSKL